MLRSGQPYPGMKISQVFYLWAKKITSGQVKKYLGQSKVSSLFIAVWNYALVGSGLISNFWPPGPEG